MKSTPDRSVVTRRVAQFLTDANILAGIVKAPDGAGWDKEPAAVGAKFTPYVVLTPMAATSPDGSLGDSSMDWRLPYTLTSYGVDGVQVEDLADDARRVLADVRRVNITMKDGVTTWKITQTTCQALGAVAYQTSLEPPTQYSQSDTLLVWLSKNL